MKNTSVRRALAWALVLVMTLSAVPFGVFAEEAEPVEKCLCTEKCTEDTRREDCPICAPEDADLEKVCRGEAQQPEAQDAGTPVEEEADKKVSEDAAAKAEADKKAAEEAAKAEAEKQAAEEAAKAEADKRAAEEAAAKAEAEKQAAEEAAAKAEAERKAAEEAAAKAEAERKAAEEAKTLEAKDGENAVPTGECTCTEKCTANTAAASGCAVCAAEGANLDDVCKGTEMKDFTVKPTLPAGSIWSVTAGGVTETAEAGQKELTLRIPKNTTKAEITVKYGGYTKQVSGELDFIAAVNFIEWMNTVTVQTTGAGTLETSQLELLNADALKFELNDAYDMIVRVTVSENSGVLSYSMEKNIHDYGWEPEAKPINIRISCDATNRNLAVLDAAGSPLSSDKYEIKGGDLYLYNWNSGETYQLAEQVTLTLNGNGGKVSGSADSASVVVPKGHAYTPTQTATRDDYVFLGWAADKDAVKADASITPNKDTTLYAVWRKPVVTFDPDGGTMDAEATVSVDADNKLAALPAAKRGDYYFQGWYLEDGTKVTTDTVFHADATVTAHWFKAEVPSDVQLPDAFFSGSYMENVESLEFRKKPASKDSVNDLLAKLPERMKSGKMVVLDVSILAQKTGETDPTPITTVNGLISFTIPMDLAELAHRELVVCRIHDGELRIMEPSRGDKEGYSLDERTGVVTVYASKFSTYAAMAVPYTVHFDPNGGTMDAKDVQTGADGKLTETLPDPGTKTGYTRNEDLNKVWKNGDKFVDQNTVYTANTTLVAQWNAITYKVIFNGNGGNVENTLKTTETRNAKYDEKVAPPTFVRDYYKFTGWAKNEDGTEPVELPLKNLADTQGAEVTLYAQWEYDPRTVTFDVGEGFTVTKDGKDVRYVDVLTQENPINTVKATDIPVPNEREGWVFQGWYTEKDGKGDLVVPGGASKATVFKTDSTVYAYWKEFEPVTVTLNAKGGTMRLNGKNVSSTTMDTKWPGVLDGTLPTPGRTGYKFEGWYTGAGIKVDEDTIFLRDTTIYARWQRAVSRTGNPKTGDQVRLGLAVGILVVAAAGLGAAVVIKKRKK